MNDIYQRNGFETRLDYISSLIETYGLPRIVVFQLANLLGAAEDFDGLITELNELSLSPEYL